LNQLDPLVQAPTLTAVNIRRLHRVGSRPKFLDYLVNLWDYRHFVYYDSRARVISGNSQDRLGGAWLILTPLLNGAVYYLIFGILLGTGRGIENFISYLIIGLFLFQFSTRTIATSARSLTSNRNVLQAFRFPRATLPIAVNVREALSSVPTIIVMLLLIILIPPAEVISIKWLFLIPAVILQSVFHLGVSLAMARIVAFVPDVAHLLGFVLRAWLYFSAVFFSVDRFADHPWIIGVMNANPMFVILDIARDCLLYDTWPSMARWLTLCTWAFASLAAGIVFFWRAEERYGRN
jgi:teichoic acid transport system permease protein